MTLRLSSLRVLMGLLFCAGGCAETLEQKELRLLRLAGETEASSWKEVRTLGLESFAFFQGQGDIVDYGDRAIPFATNLLQRFDPRLRCVGITIIKDVKGKKGARDEIIEQLDDPYWPIRTYCWSWLADINAVPRFPCPDEQSSIEEWKAVKKELQSGVTTITEDEFLRIHSEVMRCK